MEYSWFLAGLLMAVSSRQQYAPNHPSPRRIFPDFLSRLNHGAIQRANKEPSAYIHTPPLFILAGRTTSERTAWF